MFLLCKNFWSSLIFVIKTDSDHVIGRLLDLPGTNLWSKFTHLFRKLHHFGTYVNILHNYETVQLTNRVSKFAPKYFIRLGLGNNRLG